VVYVLLLLLTAVNVQVCIMDSYRKLTPHVR